MTLYGARNLTFLVIRFGKHQNSDIITPLT